MEMDQRAIVIISRVTATLSVIGSTWIINEVLSDKKKIGMVYHRLVLGASAFDFLTSFWLALGSVPMPEGSWYGAKGNFTTCEMQGFFIVLGGVPPMYTAAISLYYLLSIRYGFREVHLYGLEKWVHILLAILFFTFASAGIPLHIYNPLVGVCAIAAHPFGCTFIPGLKCERGERQRLYAWLFVFGWIWLSIGISVLSLLLVYLTVNRTERRSSRFRYSAAIRMSVHRQAQLAAAAAAAAASDDDDDSQKRHYGARILKPFKRLRAWFRETRNNHSSRRNKYSKEVAAVSLGYVASLLITWIPITLYVTVLQSITYIEIDPQTISVLIALTNPSQGFLNFLVYMRPRYQVYLSTHPEWTRCTLLWKVMQRPFQRDKDDEDHKYGSCADLPEEKEVQEFPDGDEEKEQKSTSTADDQSHRQESKKVSILNDPEER